MPKKPKKLSETEKRERRLRETLTALRAALEFHNHWKDTAVPALIVRINRALNNEDEPEDE